MQTWNMEPTISKEEQQLLMLIHSYKAKISRYAYRDTKKYRMLSKKVEEWTQQLAVFYAKKEAEENKQEG